MDIKVLFFPLESTRCGTFSIKIMKYFFSLILLFNIVFGISCDTTKTLASNMESLLEEVNLQISIVDTIITKELKINCKLSNNSKTEIAILGRFDVATMESPEYVWHANIFFKGNGRQKMLPIILLGDFKLPISEEYIILKPGGYKEFIFTFNFDDLGDSSEITTDHKNTDYGEYTITISYKDVYCNHEYALKGQIESNKIKVTYKK